MSQVPSYLSPLPKPNLCAYESQPLIRRVTGITGRISFSKEQNLYFISHGVSGTYDTVWIGYVCNLPDQYKVLDKQVIFSGEYRKGPDRQSTVGGEESYYLFLTEVK